MHMIRPELRDAFYRWREALAGLGVVLLGLWAVFRLGGFLVIPGVLALILGAALIWIGVQQARFRIQQDGIGTVDVDEGQVAYFGPQSGGMVSLKELERLSLNTNIAPPHWQLDQPGTPALMIPVNANGSDALFDAFATLPGLRTEKMLSELRSGKKQEIVIWERKPSRPAGTVLH